MSPELITLLEKLSTMGGQAGMLLLAVYYLGRTLKTQYDGRIEALEKHVAECERHRLELGSEIRAIQNDRISKMERLLEGEG